MSEGSEVTVVMGFRDHSGRWTGGEPVIAYRGRPGPSGVKWGLGSWSITAPSVNGDCWLWAMAIDETEPGAAVRAFKDQAQRGTGECRLAVGGRVIGG